MTGRVAGGHLHGVSTPGAGKQSGHEVLTGRAEGLADPTEGLQEAAVHTEPSRPPGGHCGQPGHGCRDLGSGLLSPRLAWQSGFHCVAPGVLSNHVSL